MSNAVARHQQNLSKSQFYARYLDSVRCLGLWSQQTPLSIKVNLINNLNRPNSNEFTNPIIWSELIRKFLKHNPNRILTIEIVNVELNLRSFIQGLHEETGYDDDQIYLNDDFQQSKSILPPLLSNQLHVKKVNQLISKLKTSLVNLSAINTEPRLAIELTSANIIIAFSHYLIGEFDQALQLLDQAIFQVPESTGLDIEKYDLTLLVMGLSLKALANERIESPSPIILRAYYDAIELYDRCLNYMSIGPLDETNHELHGWAELALYRICILSQNDLSETLALEAHRRYQSRCKYWPPSFRLHKRCQIYKSFTKLLFQTARSESWKPSPNLPTNNFDPSASTSSEAKQTSSSNNLDWVAWRAELLQVERLYDVVLKIITSFPKAGSVNHMVLEFCDLIFEGWKLGGLDRDNSTQVIKMLNEAYQKTFHSQRIPRYLIYLLDFQREWTEAEAALDLYCQLFNTSRTLTVTSLQGNDTLDPSDSHSDHQARETNLDLDSDKDFIETITYASRILVKFLNNPEKALRLLERASEVMQGSKDQSLLSDSIVKSRLIAMKGIIMGGLAEDADQETRTVLHQSYLKLLIEAVELEPTSYEAFYHLSYAQAELRDIDSAIASARKAIDINPNSVVLWHLLCLLTSASKEFKLALDIADVGLATTEDEPDGEMESRTAQGSSSLESTQAPIPQVSMSLSGHNESTSEISENINQPDHSIPKLSSFNSVHLKVPVSHRSNREEPSSPSETQYDPPKPDLTYDKIEQLEATIQLKMTKNALIESIQGPEVALSDQQSLFAYFAQISPQLRSQDIPKPSLDPLTINNGVSSFGEKKGLSLSRSLSNSVKRKTRLMKSQKSASNNSINGIISNSNNQLYPLKAENVTTVSGKIGDVEAAEVIDEITSKSTRILQDMWLISAGTFRRWGKLNECKGAIQEAEILNEENPKVWIQLGLYHLSKCNLSLAIDSFTKSIRFSNNSKGHDHIPAVVHLARILKEEGSIELSESLLKNLVKYNGWDIPEVWYLLSEIFRLTHRFKLQKDYLIFSLNLEKSKPIRPLRSCLPRCL
ncbi:hypothetical protein O181_016182 [Austropuccinia psidii MF-1]|uniref:TPR-like protein n=1 Tax=Austropuccinia psidii MF-1 TaxID=1389203 RepID=A0A9Q3C3I2_9BASI|nr:hypothetical protein [Austropuccinia psidii MF-1]